VKIAQLSPLFETVPPVAYGGTERVIASLCDGLSAMGHEVTLFAAGGSSTLAELVEMAPSPLRTSMSRRQLVEVAPHLHLKMLAEVYRRADQFDVIHSHADIWTLPFVDTTSTPTVVTMHGRLDLDHVRTTLPIYPDVPLVSISKAQRVAVADIPVRWADTVYNGLHLDRYHACQVTRGDHVVFVGRIHAEKGPAQAIEIARRTGRQLRIAAKIDPMDVEYHRDHIEPLLGGDDVMFVGELNECEKPAFYSSAAATLFPSDWPEPFGLVMIESLAAGTPVVALRRGSIPEIIVDGVTGFVCDDVEEMVDATRRVGELDPDDCRRHAAKFDAAHMCRGYERVYEAITRTAARRRPGRRVHADDMVVGRNGFDTPVLDRSA
jgi:glycosyltransferase involved in cell wall biosynthesis